MEDSQDSQGPGSEIIGERFAEPRKRMVWQRRFRSAGATAWWLRLATKTVLPKMKTLKFLLALVPCAALAWDNLDYGIPGACDQIVEREGYALGYSKRYEQPLWVSYRLTADEATNRVAKFSRSFYYDSSVRKGTADPGDYAGSDYARGHLAPAADMRFSRNALVDSFSMANVCPQWPGFNVGVWKRLEKRVRDLAVRDGKIFIVTGPVFLPDSDVIKIGKENKIRVPDGFYKVVLDEKPPMKMFGVIVPNEASPRQLKKFAVSADEVEKKTGLDFFYSLPYDVQTNLESKVELL